jgi:hypothetical protein
MIAVAETLRVSTVVDTLSTGAIREFNRAPVEVKEKVIEQVTLSSNRSTLMPVSRSTRHLATCCGSAIKMPIGTSIACAPEKSGPRPPSRSGWRLLK